MKDEFQPAERMIMGAKEEIANIGAIFKHRRKEMNLSLKEAENATSIRVNYLQAIETGEISKIISPIYAQGFIKQYASFLGIDGEAIVKEHPELFSRPQPQEFSYGIGTLEVRDNPGAGVKWLPNAMWIIAFVATLLAAWWLTKYLEII